MKHGKHLGWTKSGLSMQKAARYLHSPAVAFAALSLLIGPAQLGFAAPKMARIDACIDGDATHPEVEPAYVRRLVAKAAGLKNNFTRIRYGDAPDEYGDLQVPAGKGPFPVAIVIHGGRWRSDVSSDYTVPLADMLAKNGFAVWNVEFRRVGSGGEWPGSFRSIAKAADSLRSLASQYPIDLKKVVAIGHSSGGHYALWLGARGRVPTDSDIYVANPIKLRGVVSLDGAPDLASFATLPRGRTVIPPVLGNATGVELTRRLRDSSPIEMLPLGVPQLFVTQKSDRLPIMMRYMAKASAAGDRIEHHFICPAYHLSTADPDYPGLAPFLVSRMKAMVK